MEHEPSIGASAVNGIFHKDVVPILRKVLQEKLDVGVRGHEIAVLESATDRIEYLTFPALKESLPGAATVVLAPISSPSPASASPLTKVWHALWPLSFCRGEHHCEICGKPLR
jgi:hypothetical protein